jgi:hypothetical protein
MGYEFKFPSSGGVPAGRGGKKGKRIKIDNGIKESGTNVYTYK